MRTQTMPRAARAAALPPTTERAGLLAARRMSALLLPLMALASLCGLLIDGLYQEPAEVEATFRAHDLMILVFAVPALAAGLLPSLRGSPRARLVWVSALAYGTYVYSFYVFGLAFNDVFLLHVALFSLSVFSFALALANLDVAAVARSFGASTPVRTVSGLLLVAGVGIAAAWIFNALRFAITGEAPVENLMVAPIESTHLAYVLDLALLVPGYVVAAVLLWRRAAWGYALATVMLVSGLVLQFNYMVGLVLQAAADVPGATAFDPVEPFIAAIFAVGAAIMLRAMRRGRRATA